MPAYRRAEILTNRFSTCGSFDIHDPTDEGSWRTELRRSTGHKASTQIYRDSSFRPSNYCRGGWNEIPHGEICCESIVGDP